MLSETIRKQLCLFQKCKEISSVLLVGSTTSHNDFRDIDILIFVDNLKSGIRQLNDFSNFIKTPYELSDDAYRFLIGGTKELSIVIKLKGDFVVQIDEILRGKNIQRQYKSWAVGGFFPEILLRDIEEAIPIWENSEHFLKIIKKTITKRKSVFFRTIYNSLEEEINLKTKYLKNRYNSSIFDNTLITDLQIAWIRLIFAQEKMFFPGLKRYNAEIKTMSLNSQKRIKQIEKNKNYIKNIHL